MLPEGRSVELYMRSLDVIHAFFVPQFSQKEDIVPGLVTQLHITPARARHLPARSATSCAASATRSCAPKPSSWQPAAFNEWLAEQKKTAAPAPPSTTQPGTTGTTSTSTTPSSSAAGLSVFNANGCSGCHTLSAAGATGKVGPDLDKLVSYAKTAKQPLEAFVHESIVNPNAYIQPGYPKSVMPGTFGQSLNSLQLNALVAFLVQSAQQEGMIRA